MPPRPQDSNFLDAAARADQAPAVESASVPAADDWEVVPFNGMPPLGASTPAAMGTHDDRPPLVKNREGELQSRIRDLNHCNEVLLSRVHQLEEALERSQQALQQEVERSQRLTEGGKLAAAQSHSTAQLLAELEQSNAALERQTILAETLAAQLQTYQERSEHLEKECAVLRKQHTEKQQLLQAREEACADLRSRLQRQQRYTLQFKTALEKCLDTSAFKQANGRLDSDAPQAGGAAIAAGNPLAMPRSERIQPWSATDAAAQADPQLLSLVRAIPGELGSPPLPENPPLTAAPPAPSTPAMPFAAPIAQKEAGEAIAPPDSAAQQQLWQDVERVLNHSATPSQAASSPSAPVAAAPASSPATEEAQFTVPIPWGAPVPPAHSQAMPSEAATVPAPPRQEPPEPLEPSLSVADSSPESVASAGGRPPSVPEAYRQSVLTAAIPALEAMQTPLASPSPLVHPLRPAQRKRKSLSAVELPSFPPLPKVKSPEA